MPNPYYHPLKIGSLELKNNLALAPMAGTTDVVYRPICCEMGAGLVVTELVSARGICYDTGLKRSWRYLEIDPAHERPVAIQLFGADPEDFIRAIDRIHQDDLLSQCDLIDINMGCPVPKVVRGGEGASLMKDPALAGQIIEACVSALEKIAVAGADVGRPASHSNRVKPVTAKFRKGWDSTLVNAVDFARICETAGASMVAVHARTRDQYYGGKADWSIIGDVKQAVRIPVYGNGDIHDSISARRMIEETGADGLMVGRAALGNPWIFQQLTAELQTSGADRAEWTPADAPKTVWTPPAASEKAEMMMRHLRGLAEHLGEHTGVAEMRKQLAAYLRGSREAAHWKNLVMQARTVTEIEAILTEWTSHQA